jgi:ligand-binding sensor domain-containing protein
LYTYWFLNIPLPYKHFIFYMALLWPICTGAQLTQISFKHLTNSRGLSNATIRCIAQDSYGFMWIGTLHGLNCYNGYQVTSFFHEKNEPGSLPGNAISSLFCDQAGVLWVGGRNFLCSYSRSTNSFQTCHLPPGMGVFKMQQLNEKEILLATNKGLYVLDKKERTIQLPAFRPLQQVYVNDIFRCNNGDFYFACRDGLRVFNPANRLYRHIILADTMLTEGKDQNNVLRVARDQQHNVWVSCGPDHNRLWRLDTNFRKVKDYPAINKSIEQAIEDRVSQLLSDQQGTFWLATLQKGLYRYNAAEDNFTRFAHDHVLKNSLASNNVYCLFADKDGGIWAGTEGYGVDWYYPDRNHFTNIQITFNQQPTLRGNWCRAACEDINGKLWLGTDKGLSCFDLSTQQLSNFYNTKGGKKILHSNSIRSLAADKKGYVWIGTGAGLNRYDTRTGKIEFMNEKQGIPEIFTWCILVDNKDDVWVGGNSGIYRWNERQHRFENFKNDSLLGKYTNRVFRTLYQDSRGRYWFGFNGALLYDPATRTVQEIAPDTTNANSLIDPVVTNFAEDRKGIIWISSFGGLSGFDKEHNRFRNYNRHDGLPRDETAGLLVDDADRVWMGTGNGLCYLDTSRKQFVCFDTDDGLCSNQFGEQSACKLRNGMFVYPTYDGFVLFKPDHVQRNDMQAPVYITSFKVLNSTCTDHTHPEAMKRISLEPQENFFSIELTSPWYRNVSKTWYAYKLKGFDKDWHYTQDRLINYTNVPGGNYIFLYKCTTNPYNWNTPEKQLAIHIDTPFTQTAWFNVFVLTALLALGYGIYRYRLYQREKWHRLHSKASMLEKEKAMAMYDALKQHLNPHFLFNSLTSLSGLIQIDPKKAAEFLDQMSQIYRYILRNKETELVHLSDEINFVELYISLLKTRFSAGLDIQIQVPADYNYRKVVPVTLQNLIENAIKHNVIDEEAPLVISISVNDDYLVVSNNLQKKKFVATSNKQGLENLRSFYSYLTTLPVLVSETETAFIVKIPLL